MPITANPTGRNIYEEEQCCERLRMGKRRPVVLSREPLEANPAQSSSHLQSRPVRRQCKQGPRRSLDHFEGRPVLLLQVQDTEEHQQSWTTRRPTGVSRRNVSQECRPVCELHAKPSHLMSCVNGQFLEECTKSDNEKSECTVRQQTLQP
jgi:hypothetical protein